MAVNINVPSQVKTYANLAAFPATGALKTIYIAEDTNKTYRWTGSVYVEVSASASGITIGSTAIASGVVGRVLFEGAGNVVQESGNLFWDNTNGRLGIGTSSPATPLDVRGGFNLWASGGHYLEGLATSGTDATLRFRRVSDNGWVRFTLGASSSFQMAGHTGTGEGQLWASSGGYFWTFYTNGSERMRIPTTGNVLINTTTDAGYRLDVNGTARVQTSLEVAGASGVTFGGGASVLSYSGNILNIGNSATWTDVRLFAGGVQKFSQTSTLTTISNTTINLSTATVQLAGVNALTYSGTDIRIGSVAAGFNSLSMYVAGSERARIVSTGNVLINTTTDVASSLLTLESTTKGFLPPRMTTTQKNAIATPAAGLVVYDTTLNKLCVYTTAWETVTSL